MSTRDWHADEVLLRGYLHGDTDVAASASVEAHLLACAACRERLASQAPADGLDRAWGRVVAEIASPRPSLALRLLRRLGLSDADVVLLRAARSLDGAWTLATLAVIAFAALAAIDGGAGGRALYLLVAPLIPVIGVVVAFTSTDPLDDLTSSTPFSKARLALLRTAAVAITSVPLVIAFGVAVPAIGWLAVAWLAPAIVLTLLTLTAMTWSSPTTAGVAAGVLWAALIAGAYARDDVAAAVRPQLLALYLAVAVLAAASLTFRLKNAHAPGGRR